MSAVTDMLMGIPCGISDRPLTSMASILGEHVDMELVRYGLVYQFGQEFGFKMEEVVAARVLAIQGLMNNHK